MTKQCFKCGKIKDICDFYAHPKMSDGHLNKCKECTIKDVRDHREANHAEFIAYDRRRYRENPERKISAGKWSRENPEKKLMVGRAWAKRNNNKRKAQAAVAREIKSGRMSRMPCADCGTVENVHAHHPDYSKPLDVVWLCSIHHGLRHRKDYKKEQKTA